MRYAGQSNAIITAMIRNTHFVLKGLESFYDENVQYMEIRTVLPSVYYLNGTILDEMAVAGASITLRLTNSNQIIPTYLQVINFFFNKSKNH